MSSDVQRQTAYVANEQSGLTVLANAIKNGELSGGTPGIAAVAASGTVQLASAGTPLVVVRFLTGPMWIINLNLFYASLNPGVAGAAQCQLRSGGGVAHPRQWRLGADRSDHGAPSCPRCHALHDRHGRAGIPGESVASSTDPSAAAASEVRVFVR